MAENSDPDLVIRSVNKQGTSIWESISRLQQHPNWPNIQAQLREALNPILSKIDPVLDRDIDKLTGLPENSQLVRRLGIIVEQIRNGIIANVGVFYVDIDGFKRINDVYGHMLANEILLEVAKRVAQFVEGIGFASRISGDEYVVVIPDVGKETEALLKGIELKNLLDGRYEIGDKFISITTSVGYQWADKELNPLKRSSQKNFQYMVLVDEADGSRIIGREEMDPRMPSMVRFTQKAWEKHKQRQLNRENLGVIVDQGLFEVTLQPITDLKSLKIVAAELLAGNQQPITGTRTSDMTYLEDSGRIAGISLKVLEEAEECFEVWGAAGDCATRINLNVSPSQLHSSALVERLLQLSVMGALPASRITLEITERQELHDDRQTVSNIKALRLHGFEIACDDFSLSHGSPLRIANFPAFSAIKIDVAMISQITTNDRMRTMVGHIVKMADEMDLTVTAEGIADENQLQIMQEFGCHYGQGYLFGRPVPACEFNQLLAEQGINQAVRG